MIRWVFLDVGNVLLDEDPLTFFSFQRHAEAIQRRHPDRTFHDLLAEREARLIAGARWPVYEMVSAVLDEAECAELWEQTNREVRARFAELSPLIPGADLMVKRLAGKHPLGLIANQGRECRDRLDALGLLSHFSIVAFSEERGAAKPDLELFRDALRAAGCPPHECVMVGDRLDNDVAPASALGMEAIWVRWPNRAAKGWQPSDGDAFAYLQYLQSLECTAARTSGGCSETMKYSPVEEIQHVEAEITKLSGEVSIHPNRC